VDGTGSGSCPVVGFGFIGVETSGSAMRELFITASVKMIKFNRFMLRSSGL
jgi:hypothetical protein